MKPSNLFGAVVLALCGTLCAAAQESKCTLTPAQAPELRGLRLGMTPAQVAARYSRLSFGAPDEFGQTKATLVSNYLAQIDETAFRGVNYVFLNFIDNRLVEFGVGYKSLPWRDLRQFAETISKSLDLPSGWKGDANSLTLDCAGLQIRAGVSFGSPGHMSAAITFKESGAEAVIAERGAKKKEEQIQAFKP